MTSVAEMACGKAPANVCIKKCTDSVPPCIMDTVDYKAPDPKMRTAGENCTEAVPIWRKKAAAAVEPAKEGGAEPSLMQKVC